MAKTESEQSPSALAMRRFVERSPGLREPRIAERIPGLPTLPDLKKMAREQREAGREVIDQSAGDIDDVGQPLSEEFIAWIEQARLTLLAEGHQAFRATEGDAYGYPGNYQQQYPVVTETLAKSWGIKRTPFRAMQTLSGRNAIDFALRGLIRRARDEGKSGKFALILDPLAWSGYRPLAADLGLAMLHSPAVPEHGLANSAEGLRAALDFAQSQELTPIAAIPILPSNPTGVGMAQEELLSFIEHAAAADLPVMIDAFYSPLAPEGHAEAVPLSYLERKLTRAALGYLGLIVGETKVTSSQNKTGSLLWMAPERADAIAHSVVDAAATRMRTTNSYPRPREALVAYALHTFPDGIKAAMGPRYRALDATRVAMKQACDELALPLAIGGSFYGTVALVDESGESLIRDEAGAPVTDPRQVGKILVDRFGLVGAPGGMFSSAPEAGKMVRLTAAVTLEDIKKVSAIFGSMKHDA
jgi:aspartate/methionine/tyrosine aminotransferase